MVNGRSTFSSISFNDKIIAFTVITDCDIIWSCPESRVMIVRNYVD